MALKVLFEKRTHKTILKSGHIYQFNYIPYQNDPRPLIILLNIIEGLHPNTNHQWRLIQGINFNYIGTKYRKQFAKDWVNAYKNTNGNIKFTWKLIIRKYKYLKPAIRRYQLKPTYYIKNLKEIPESEVKKTIESTLRFTTAAKLRRVGKKARKLTGTRR